LDIAGISEAVAEAAQQVPERVRRLSVKKADHRHRRLLRVRRERPRRRAAEQRDERAAVHSEALPCALGSCSGRQLAPGLHKSPGPLRATWARASSTLPPPSPTS